MKMQKQFYLTARINHSKLSQFKIAAHLRVPTYSIWGKFSKSRDKPI